MVFAQRPVTTGHAHGPAIGEVGVTTARLGGDLAFGGYKLQRPMVASFPLAIRFPGFGVLMGPPLLSNFVLTIDQKDRLARFERTGDPVIPPPPSMIRIGMVVMHDEQGRLRIAAVQPGGGAETARPEARRRDPRRGRRARRVPAADLEQRQGLIRALPAAPRGSNRTSR